MSLTHTKFNLLATNLGQRLTGVFEMNPLTGKSRMYEGLKETTDNADLVEARLTLVESTLAEAKSVANVAALKALVTTTFDDGQFVAVESTGVLYRFNLGEAVGSEDPPDTYDATDAGGVYHVAGAKSAGIHLPVADIAGLKAIIAAGRGEGMLCFVKANGAGVADIYRFDASSVAGEALPGIVAPTAGTGRWIAVGVSDLKAYYDGLYAAIGHTHATLPTADEKAALVGTSGTAPSAANPLVDNADTRMTNSRTPTAHAASHATIGVDAIAPADIGAEATGVAAGLLATKVLTPVADATALAALDVGGALAAGVSCLVRNRGDANPWRYEYVVGAVPNPDYGTIGGVDILVTGTNGYWVPEDLASYLLHAEGFDRQRLGAIGGGIRGAASAWFLSAEGNNVNGHGFTLNYDGAHPEEVVVADAIKALCTSVALTETYLNIAIVAQTTGANARARVVYDDVAGAYCVVWPSDVDTGTCAITAPALANDIGIAGKLSVETGAIGTRVARMSRAQVEALRTHAAGNGADHANVAASTAALLTLPSKGSVAVAVLPLTGGIFTAGNTVDIGGVAFTARVAPGGAGSHEFATTGVLDTEVDNLVLVINNAADNAVKVKAVKPGADTLAIFYSDATHVPEVAAVPDSIALARTITGPLAGAWSALNLNLNGAAPSILMAHGRVVVSGEMATAMGVGTGINLAKIPFATTAVSSLQLTVRDGAGVLKAVTDEVTIDTTSDTIVVKTAGAGAHIVATDVLDFIVIG